MRAGRVFIVFSPVQTMDCAHSRTEMCYVLAFIPLNVSLSLFALTNYPLCNPVSIILSNTNLWFTFF